MIELLDNHLINQIAAGEVIESPHSVVKELVENAIDAKSTKIEVTIEKGGMSLIQVADNGEGIAKDSLTMALTRHATSKLSRFNDLFSLSTLGFRGEALPSMAGVSKMSITTKQPIDAIGSFIYVEGGEVIEISNKSAALGTVVELRELFFNLPVRRNFLKQPSSEAAKISQLMNKLALGHPHISFLYTRDKQVIFKTTGKNDPKTVFYQVYGNELLPYLLPVEYEQDDIQITGLLGKPEAYKGNRSYMHFFLQGRLIYSHILDKAVEDAYKTRLPIGRFPVVLLYMNMSLSQVDINVHPQKLEVRFADERTVYDAVYDCVFNTLEGVFLVQGKRPAKNSKRPTGESREIKTLPFKTTDLAENIIPPTNKMPGQIAANIALNTEQFAKFSEIKKAYEAKAALKPPGSLRENDPRAVFLKDYIPTVETLADLGTYPPTTNGDTSKESPPRGVLKPVEIEPSPAIFKDYRMLGQVFGTYWIIEDHGNIYFIDQHAAHERIIYERLFTHYQGSQGPVQPLLEPQILPLNDGEFIFLAEHMNLFLSFGYELEAFGPNTYALRSIPYVFNEPIAPSFIRMMIEVLMEHPYQGDSLYDFFAEQIALLSCKEAVKGNHKLSEPEAREIITSLLTLQNPFTCPHGRPTMWKMSEYELEKNFLRVIS